MGWQAVGDIVVGSVLGPSSQRANECRIAMFLAGFPEVVPVRTVNRCAIQPLGLPTWAGMWAPPLGRVKCNIDVHLHRATCLQSMRRQHADRSSNLGFGSCGVPANIYLNHLQHQLPILFGRMLENQRWS